MRQEIPFQFCLEDFKGMSGGASVETTFRLIKQCIAAIEAKEGKVFGYRYSNEPHKHTNPCVNMPTIFFDVGTRYEYHDSGFELTLMEHENEFPSPFEDYTNTYLTHSIGVEWKITLQKPTKDSKTK